MATPTPKRSRLRKSASANSLLSVTVTPSVIVPPPLVPLVTPSTSRSTSTSSTPSSSPSPTPPPRSRSSTPTLGPVSVPVEEVNTTQTPTKRKLALQRLVEIEEKVKKGLYVTVENARGKRAARASSSASSELDADGGSEDGSRAFCVWDWFDVVVDKDTKLEMGAVRCRGCQKLMSYASASTGTSSLTGHVRSSCPGRMPDKQAGNYVPPPPSAKSQFVDKLADFCAVSMSSMNHMVNDAFVDLTQVALDVGAHCAPRGRVDAREMVPRDSTTIADRIEVRANETRKLVIAKVGEAIDQGRCRCTTDMWTDDNNKWNWVDITAHFTNAECTGQESHFLVLAKFPADLEKTGVNIRNAIFRTMVEEFKFSAEQFNKIEWVTDRGSNMIKAFENDVREDCSAHLINTVVKGTLTITYQELRKKALNNNPRAEEILRAVGQIVKVVKQVKKNEKLMGVNFDTEKFKSKLEYARPQNASFLGMLRSVTSHRKKVVAVLEAKGRPDLLPVLDDEGLQELVDFLEPLEKKGDVPAGNLRNLREHLRPAADVDEGEGEGDGDDDSGSVNAHVVFIEQMKESLRQERLLMEILIQIRQSKDVVNYLKASGMEQLLDKRLVQDVETRWNSLCDLLESLLNQFDKAEEVLREGGQLDRMKGVTKESVEWLVDFLRPFRAETDKLQGESYPTTPLVLPAIYRLRAHCSGELFDSPARAALRERAYRMLMEKMEPSLRQKVSTFLWPKYHQLLMLPPAEREEVFQEVRRIIAREDVGTLDADDPGPRRDDGEPSPKRQRSLFEDGYDEWSSKPEEDPLDEVAKYLKTAKPVAIDELYAFWKPQADPISGHFPKLAKIAHRELGKPATSAPSERVFSKAGFIMNARRNKLSSKTANNLLFMHYFLKSQKGM